MANKTGLRHAMRNADALAGQFCRVLKLDKLYGYLVACGDPKAEGRVFYMVGDGGAPLPDDLSWAGRASTSTLVSGPDGLVETIPADCLAAPGYRLEHNLVSSSQNAVSEDNIAVSSGGKYRLSIAGEGRVGVSGAMSAIVEGNGTTRVSSDLLTATTDIASIHAIDSLLASDAGADDLYGVACAISGDGAVLAVGAYGWNGPAGSAQGATYIYDWSGTEWIERGILTASDAGADDLYGVACAISGDGAVLAVGASRWDGPAVNQGATYIYDWSGTEWIERGILTASDAGADDYYGVACAISGDGAVLAVGAYGWDGPAGNQGATYIYDWSGTEWIERGILTASDAGADDYYGFACAISGDGAVLAVGAYGWDGPAGSAQGAVYIYDWSGAEWVSQFPQATDVLFQDVTGRSNQNPSEYVSVGVESAPIYHGAGVDGYKYFSTTNGNTVNADGSINEAVGPSLPGPLRLRLEPAATNYFLNSSAPVTQTVTLTNGNEYTFQVVGTGSMAMSGGATGTVTEGSQVTATVTGNVTCTLAGSVDYAQVEGGAIATSIIITGAAAATRAADAPLQWPLTTPQDEGMSVLDGEYAAAGTGGLIGFRTGGPEGPLYKATDTAQACSDSAGTINAVVAAHASDKSLVFAARWSTAEGDKECLNQSSGSWISSGSGTKGTWTTDAAVVIGHSITAPLHINTVSVYDVDKGRDFIEGNWS